MPSKRRHPGLQVVNRPGTEALYLRGTVAGRRVYESAGTARPELAEERRAAREAEIYRAAVHGPAPVRHTLGQAILGYLKDRRPTDATKSRIDRLYQHLGARIRCDEIDQAAVDRAADALLRPGYAPATKLREIVTPVRAILSWAAVRQWCVVPAFERGAPGRSRTEWRSPDQVEALIAAAAPHLQPLIEFLFGTGARKGEALGLDWSDVQLADARVLLRDTKNGRDRLAHLPPRVVAALANLPGREGRVFRCNDGMPYTDHGQFRGAWGTACRKAGWPGEQVIVRRRDRMRHDGVGRFMPDHTPHVARHTWASWHYALHRDLLRLKRDGDWSSVGLVERYAHLVPDSQVAEVRTWLTGGAVLLKATSEEGRSA